jgi:hypothetical protein
MISLESADRVIDLSLTSDKFFNLSALQWDQYDKVYDIDWDFSHLEVSFCIWLLDR